MVLVQHQEFINFSYILPSKWAGREQLTQTDQRDGYSTACNIMLSNTNWFCDRGCLSKAAAAQTLAGHWSTGGIIEELCICWDCVSSPSLIKISLSWPMSFFLAFALPVLSPIPLTRRNEQSGWVLSCWPRSTHPKVKSFSWGWDWDSFTIRCPQEITYVPRLIYETHTIFWLSCKNVHCSGFTLLCHHVALFLSLKENMC